MSEIICPICKNKNKNLTFVATEKLIGTREKFNYGECSSCKAVFLLDQIEDFAKYYPEGYHCFDDDNYPKRKQFLLKQIYNYNFWGKGAIGSITSKVFAKLYGHKPEQNICWISKAARHINPDINTQSVKNISLLDIGCGSGGLLKQLKYIGFEDLNGVEPYGNPKSEGINFIKSNIHDYIAQNHTKKYDIVVLSHVMEHLYHHEEILKGLNGLLSDKGVIVIAMPFTGKLFDKYKENWLSLDAPRHLIINSIQSFQDMVDRSGLNIIDTFYEQKGWDIFASEMYSWDIGFAEINVLGAKDFESKKHNMIADIYNKQKQGGSSVTFFITK